VLVGVLGAGAAAAGAAVAAGGGGDGDEGSGGSQMQMFMEIHGEVYATFGPNPANPTGPGLYGPPVAGATVTTTLDGGLTTTTDGSGRFALITRTPQGGCRLSTLTIVAAGHPTYSLSGRWQSTASQPLRFTLSPPGPATFPGCP
jgi:hypothetical protein